MARILFWTEPSIRIIVPGVILATRKVCGHETYQYVIFPWPSGQRLNMSQYLFLLLSSSHILRSAHIYNRTQQSPTLLLCSASWGWASNAWNMSRPWTSINCKGEMFIKLVLLITKLRVSVCFISVGSELLQIYPIFWMPHTTTFLYVFFFFWR
jgi:hypothetical protein